MASGPSLRTRDQSAIRAAMRMPWRSDENTLEIQGGAHLQALSQQGPGSWRVAVGKSAGEGDKVHGDGDGRTGSASQIETLAGQCRRGVGVAGHRVGHRRVTPTDWRPKRGGSVDRANFRASSRCAAP